ncbi:MAG: sulfurtransferase complex subunit TusC [Methylococcaceae bacterium]
MKRFLFILGKAPYEGLHVQETLDMILATAAFEQSVSLLFLDQAVFQLNKNQHPGHQAVKETASIFKSLPLYDVEKIYIETESLGACGLTEDNLILPVILINRQEIASFIAEHQVVINH